MELDEPVYLRLVNKREKWLKMRKNHRLPCLNVPTSSTRKSDRLSPLPNKILRRILSKMPIESAIRTSILSSRWRDLWERISVVDFHRLPLYDRTADYAMITRTLNRIESRNIFSFTILGHISDRHFVEILKWFDFAISKNVRRLRIGLVSVSTLTTYFSMPELLLTDSNCTKNLEILFLNRVDFKASPSAFNAPGFSLLSSLGFSKCKLADIVVKTILRKCLVLEYLALDQCTGLEIVDISGSHLKLKQLTFRWPEFTDDEIQKFRLLSVDAPTLVTLEYSGDFTKIVLSNCEALETAILLGKEEPVNEDYLHDIRYLAYETSAVKTLSVNFQFLEFVSREYYSRGWPFIRYENLETLCWLDSPKTPNDIHNLVAFIGDCPSLNFFVIEFCEEHWSAFSEFISADDVEDEFQLDEAEEEGAFRCLYEGRLMENLKTIQLVCFSAFTGELILLESLLRRAVNLETLKINWRLSDLSPMNDNVMQTIVQTDHPERLASIIQEEEEATRETIDAFYKASPNVQIIYSHNWGLYQWGNFFDN